MKVVAWVNSDRVREMCIRYDYYTRGDCLAYNRMLNDANDMSTDDYEGLKRIVVDIYDHSKMQDDKEYSKKDYVEGIISDILKSCTDMYVDLEEGEV